MGRVTHPPYSSTMGRFYTGSIGGEGPRSQSLVAANRVLALMHVRVGRRTRVRGGVRGGGANLAGLDHVIAKLRRPSSVAADVGVSTPERLSLRSRRHGSSRRSGRGKGPSCVRHMHLSHKGQMRQAEIRTDGRVSHFPWTTPARAPDQALRRGPCRRSGSR